MRAVVQRVSRAKVTVDGNVTGEIAHGSLVLLGVSVADEESDADYLVDDRARHFTRFKGRGLLFSAPHNHHEHRYPRVSSWAEVREFFAGLDGTAVRGHAAAAAAPGLPAVAGSPLNLPD